MSLLRNMDLYKAIVLLSLVLLPVGGWMIKRQDDDIAACKKAIDDATRQGGLLEQIGGLQRKVEIVVQNKHSMSEAIKNPGVYFQDQIQLAAQGIRANDFQPMPPKGESFTLKGSKTQVADFVVDVNWLRKDPVGLDFIYAAIFNCESGARQVGDPVQQSVWKLRELIVENATGERLLSAYKTPPLQLDDKWTIRKLSFARREPSTKKS